MGDVVEDLRAEALTHDAGRHAAGTEAGQARRLGVVAGHAFDGRLDIPHGNLDRELPAGFVDVYEFCFH